MNRWAARNRILGVSPCKRGVGFVVLVNGEALHDWGVSMRGPRTLDATLNCMVRLVERYRPYTIAIEAPATSFRHRQIRRLAAALIPLAADRGTRVHLVYSYTIRQLCPADLTTKHARASHLTEQFPELRSRLPKPRAWRSESEAMSVFDALALAFAASREDEIWERTA